MIVRNGRKGLRSLLSLILAVNILLSLFPVGAYAEDIGTTEEPAAAVEAVAPEESAESEEADAEGDTAPAEEPEAAADAAETSDEAAPAAPAQEDADTPEQQTEEDAAGEDAAPAEDAAEEPDAADESAELPEEAEDLANERPRLVARVGSIRSSLDQDAAHLTNFKVSDVVTGTAPWDADDARQQTKSFAHSIRCPMRYPMRQQCTAIRSPIRRDMCGSVSSCPAIRSVSRSTPTLWDGCLPTRGISGR